MRIVITSEVRYQRTPDGAVWTPVGSYALWRRYLEVFDEVRVVARLFEVRSAAPGTDRSDGPGVKFHALPCYQGPWSFLLRSSVLVRAARRAAGKCDAVILRAGSPLASCIESVLTPDDRPYGVEVVGDPYEVFAPGVISHPLRPLLRYWFARRQHSQCARACAAAYVTERALQDRYPCPAYATGVSDVEIEDEAIVKHARSYAAQPGESLDRRPWRAVTVASLEQLYKGTDLLIGAMARCRTRGLNIRLTVVGDGRHRMRLKSLAARLGLADCVEFLGMLPAGKPVRDQLDGADLFVLPSRTEGLPRALVEAMARGLPAIAASVGGVPELLPSADLVPPGDSITLASRICEVTSDLGRMTSMSERNLKRAGDFRSGNLRKRREGFYRQVRDCTDDWLRNRGSVRADPNRLSIMQAGVPYESPSSR